MHLTSNVHLSGMRVPAERTRVWCFIQQVLYVCSWGGIGASTENGGNHFSFHELIRSLVEGKVVWLRRQTSYIVPSLGLLLADMLWLNEIRCVFSFVEDTPLTCLSTYKTLLFCNSVKIPLNQFNPVDVWFLRDEIPLRTLRIPHCHLLPAMTHTHSQTCAGADICNSW